MKADGRQRWRVSGGVVKSAGTEHRNARDRISAAPEGGFSGLALLAGALC